MSGLVSIADARPRNIESVRTPELIPGAIRENAKNLVLLLEQYYNYLNQAGLPSNEIASIVSNKDIDLVSSKYFTQIKELIGKNVPNSHVLTEIDLYKTAVQYYNSRGSDISIHTFFKMFFNRIVEVIYPKEFVFKLSEGEWNGTSYNNHKSFPSDDYKLFDGRYFQDYSYVIRSDFDTAVWRDDYVKLIHPAGLQLFTAIIIEIFLENRWEDELVYKTTDINNDDTWLQAFIPPHNRNFKLNGYHTPKFQPGWLRERILKFLFTYLFDHGTDNDLLARLVFISLKSFLVTDTRNHFVREQYQGCEKFIDTCEIGAGFLGKTIEQASETYFNTNLCRLLNLSAIITIDRIWEYGFYDTAGGSGSGAWNSSYYDTAGGSGSGAWEDSSYENL